MNTGKIRRSKCTENYTTIPNAFLQRKDLSLKAKGLLCLLLSLPEDWAIHRKQLPEWATDGYESVNTAFKELSAKSYILGEKVMDGTRFAGWNYVVFDNPQVVSMRIMTMEEDFPNTENPDTEIPDPGNTDLQSNNNTKDINTNISHAETEVSAPYIPAEGQKEIPPAPEDTESALKKRWKSVFDTLKPGLTPEEKKFNFQAVKDFLTENPKCPLAEPYVELWNPFAKRHALACIISISETRRKKVRVRSTQDTFDFIGILMAVNKSTFLIEKWQITFDWLIENDTNYLKILEGNYK